MERPTDSAIAQAKLLLEESKIDLKVARLLAAEKTDGIRRRRLFFLQQSIEKSIKSTIDEMNGLFLQLPKALAVGHLFQGKDLRKDPALQIVTARYKNIVEKYSSPKSLGHDPAARLQLRATMQDLYLFARAIGFETSLTNQILEFLSAFDEKDSLKIISAIDAIQELRYRNARQAEEAAKDSKGRGSRESMVKNYMLPGIVAAIIQINLHLMLLSRLTDFEQASRYPEERIPLELLDNLDRVDFFAALLIRFAEELGSGPSDHVWDKVKL